MLLLLREIFFAEIIFSTNKVFIKLFIQGESRLGHNNSTHGFISDKICDNVHYY